jgi:hypothetical protein
MAKPILRIKQGNAKPGNYSVITGLGLTAGELGANLIAGSYGFYIGNTFGQAITFGCEVTTDSALGGASPSDAKIPTQKALKTYVDALSVSASPSGIISRYSDNTLAVSANTPTTQIFPTSELQTILDTHLTYTSTGTNNGRFTNNSVNIMYLLVTYQITWVVPSVAVSLNFNPAKSVWIQKTFLLNDAPLNNVYGFTSLLCPPALNTDAGAITGTQNGSAIIDLAAGDSFTIQCRSPVATATTNIASVNLGTSTTTNFDKATRIQIVRL